MVGAASHVDQDGDSVITDTSAPEDASQAQGSNSRSMNSQQQQQQNNTGSTSSHAAAATTSTRSATAAPSPSGPVCSYGSRLAYTYFRRPAPSQDKLNELQDDIYFFTIDDQLLYLSFFQDSGPLNAACLYRFCLHLHALLEDESLKKRKIFLYSSDEPDKKANSALLIALYAMIVMRWPPPDVLHPIACLELQPFRDAGYARADYHLSVQSVIYGVHRAINSHLLDLATFDLASYETYEKVENGDWNWITPGFLAFASPVEQGYPKSSHSSSSSTGASAPRSLSRSFRNVLEEFEKSNVKVVVRLNKKLYDAAHFTDHGIEHVEMYFDDGTNPTMDMVREFIDLSDKVISSGAVVAVHCKAGLGRTGTLIGAYLIYKHGFTASEAIGFMRLMRPGSCVGPQQHFLYENQMTWVRWAAVDEYKKQTPNADMRPVTPATAVASTSNASATTPTRSPSRQNNGRATPLTPEQPTVPRTPSRSAVPGQPRKTPGKSKHAVATPERANDSAVMTGDMEVDEIDQLGETEQDELMLVKDDHKSAPSNAAMGTGTSMVTSPPSSPRKMSTRPTRIARARPGKPLDPISDNAAASTSTSASSLSNEVKRSKSIKDLGAPVAVAVAPSEPRYSLRKSNSGGVAAASHPQQPLQPAPSLASTRSNSGNGMTSAVPLVPAPAPAPSSPSKLPVVRKRGKRSHTIVAPSTSVPSDLSSVAAGRALPQEAHVLRGTGAAAPSQPQPQGQAHQQQAEGKVATGVVKKLGLRGIRKRRSSVGCDEGA